LFDDFPLTAHGINCYDAAFERENSEKFWNGCDLIGFFLSLDLPQHQTIFGRPSTDHVDRSLVRRPVIGMPQGFPVDGNDLWSNILKGGTHPIEEALLELLGSNHGEYPAECIMRRNPERQFQKGPKPLLLNTSKLGDFRPLVSTSQHGAKGYDYDVDKLMPRFQQDSRICE